jgi:glutathione S-transferase
MVLKLYGHIYAPSTQRILLVLHELNTPYEFDNVDISARTDDESTSPENPVKHPFRGVPYIVRLCCPVYVSAEICDDQSV